MQGSRRVCTRLRDVNQRLLLLVKVHLRLLARQNLDAPERQLVAELHAVIRIHLCVVHAAAALAEASVRQEGTWVARI